MSQSNITETLYSYGMVAIVFAIAIAIVYFVPTVVDAVNKSLMDRFVDSLINFFSRAGNMLLLIILVGGLGFLFRRRAAGGAAGAATV